MFKKYYKIPLQGVKSKDLLSVGLIYTWYLMK